GQFAAIGGRTMNSIARWNGSTWSAVGNGFPGGSNSIVNCLAVYDDDGDGPHRPALYAGGYFAVPGSSTARDVARWDGTVWSGVGNFHPYYNSNFIGIYTMGVADLDGAGPENPSLFVAGPFSSTGTTSAIGIARWNGSSWSAMGGGLPPGPDVQ